jgi:5-methylthioadenosine/S-adenosylhomocysteine deaminase
VLVAGRPVVRDGRCVTVDAEALWQDALPAQASLLERAGIAVPHVWPHEDAR